MSEGIHRPRLAAFSIVCLAALGPIAGTAVAVKAAGVRTENGALEQRRRLVAVLDTAVVEACRTCHRDGLSLDHWEAPALTGQIKLIVDGQADHLVPIPALTDEDIAELAEALSER